MSIVELLRGCDGITQQNDSSVVVCLVTYQYYSSETIAFVENRDKDVERVDK